MTPRERAVAAVETLGWLQKQVSATDITLPDGSIYPLAVTQVVVRGEVLTDLVVAAITAAVAAEREACAQRCNSIAFLYDEGSEGAKAAFDCCAAIRARGTP